MAGERCLWLRCGSGRVAGASADEVVLLLEFLEAPASLRRIADQSRRLTRRPRAVCVQRPVGLHVVLPEKLAAWLATAATLAEDDLHELRGRLAQWLAGDSKTDCRATPAIGLTGNSPTDN